jgi:hypothetical protein
MKLVFFLSITFSSFLYAQSNKKPAPNYGFAPIQSNWVAKENTEKLVNNMTSVNSQDSVGACCHFTTANILNNLLCEYQKKDCRTIPASQKVSPISTFRIGREHDEKARTDEKNCSVYSTLDFLSSPVAVDRGYISEECYSLDKILSKMGGMNDLNAETIRELNIKQSAAWQRLIDIYKRAKVPEGDICYKCELEKELNQNFYTNKTNVDLLNALGKGTLTEFMTEIFSAGECGVPKNRMKFPGLSWTARHFPKPGEARATDKDYERVILEQLSKVPPRPVGLSLCTDDQLPKQGEKCEYGHAVTVTGARTVCNGSNCKLALRIQNSWGAAWQKGYNGGWVDGAELIRRSNYDNSPANLTWAELDVKQTADASGATK